MRKIALTLLIFIISLCVISCDGIYESESESEVESAIEETTVRAPKGDKVEIDENTDTSSFCLIYGRKISFVPREEIQKLEEPLAKLLSNQLQAYGEGGDILGYTCPDPDSPALPKSYYCALMDVTGDGVAELLIHPEGYFGSSGMVSYYIYDVYSGEKIGSIDDGLGYPWCSYYNVEDDKYYFIGQYYLRGGWSYRRVLFVELAYDLTDGKYCGASFASSSHDIEQECETDSDSKDIISVDEIYPDTSYYSRWDTDDLDGYYWTLYKFNRNFIRIPETELVLLDWDDVCGDEKDLAIRGAMMAKALVNSSQMIIKPEGIELNIYEFQHEE